MNEKTRRRLTMKYLEEMLLNVTTLLWTSWQVWKIFWEETAKKLKQQRVKEGKWTCWERVNKFETSHCWRCDQRMEERLYSHFFTHTSSCPLLNVQNGTHDFTKDLHGRDEATSCGASFHLKVATSEQRGKSEHCENSRQRERQCQCQRDIWDPTVCSLTADGRHLYMCYADFRHSVNLWSQSVQNSRTQGRMVANWDMVHALFSHWSVQKQHLQKKSHKMMCFTLTIVKTVILKGSMCSCGSCLSNYSKQCTCPNSTDSTNRTVYYKF